MHTLETLAALREQLNSWDREGHSVALVPTMGNLHAGHRRLVAEAKTHADRVVVSSFVNPTQFGPGEDYAAYPHTPEEDERQLRETGADALFRPGAAEMYPANPATMTFVEVPELSGELCGHFRPGHFRGVATIACKLLNLVRPAVAVFGEKDYQQLLVIRKMVMDLNIPTRIIGIPTVREADGLALSSRNAYLHAEERAKAPFLFHLLGETAAAIHRGGRNYASLELEQMERLRLAGWRPDYFAIRRQEDLKPATAEDTALIVLAAARLGRARLIDNLGLNLTPRDRAD
jgi:pantoate--beta-alanine ligase